MTERISFESAQKKALDVARTRLLVGGALMAAAFLVIGVRLVDVTVFSETGPSRQASARNIVSETQMDRADIVDRNGVLLATSLKTASLYGDLTRITDPQAAARALVRVLPELSEAEIVQKLSSKGDFVWLSRHLTPRQHYEVNRLGIPGFDFRREERRVYPLGRLAAHVVGYTGTDNKGLAGIENSFDAALSERPEPVTLSIDVRAQQIMRRELAAQIDKFQAIGGAGVVIDVRTGEIISLVSLPDFDPNDEKIINDEIEPSDSPLFNRTTLGVYELGSVFKIFNHAIALETGAANLTSLYDARKPIHIARFRISDFHPQKRWLTVPEIFMYSSNIGSAKMALDIGSAAQRKFLTDLGLLRRSSVELPEQARPLYPAPWSEISSMTIAYGHGISVSPLHAATAVAAVVNGGVLYPATLIRRSEAPSGGKRVISAQTSDKMRKLLRLVVENGTGRNASAPGYLVGGKTGTAEKSVNGRYKRKALISSFIGVFPMNAPRYVVMAHLDEPKGIKESAGFATGGWTAAPVVGQVISQIAPLFGIAPVDESAPDIQRAFTFNVAAPRARGRGIATN
ncbi:MAG: cell division protein FtsI (penicillin-binding protein 3) [Alphaproteobacteria bacterium]|jgi:cell division protein FtsI (penicillin-binding protein 3)